MQIALGLLMLYPQQKLHTSSIITLPSPSSQVAYLLHQHRVFLGGVGGERDIKDRRDILSKCVLATYKCLCVCGCVYIDWYISICVCVCVYRLVYIYIYIFFYRLIYIYVYICILLYKTHLCYETHLCQVRIWDCFLYLSLSLSLSRSLALRSRWTKDFSLINLSVK